MQLTYSQTTRHEHSNRSFIEAQRLVRARCLAFVHRHIPSRDGSRFPVSPRTGCCRTRYRDRTWYAWSWFAGWNFDRRLCLLLDGSDYTFCCWQATGVLALDYPREFLVDGSVHSNRRSFSTVATRFIKTRDLSRKSFSTMLFSKRKVETMNRNRLQVCS